MIAPILVTGGTGTLGRHVVQRLRDAGRDIRVVSRHARASADGIEYVTADLLTGEGIDAALAGIAVIAHCAGLPKRDEELTRNLVRAASKGDVRHLVHVSVVGADRIPVVGGIDRAMFGYYGSKLAAERVVTESGLPSTTLRASQFHDLLLMIAQGMAKLPVIPIPSGFRFQPIATEEVADRVVELTLGEPAGLVADMAGPRVYGMAELVRSYLRARGVRRLLVSIPLPGKAARAFRDGANLAPGHAVGRRTWEEFLADRVE